MLAVGHPSALAALHHRRKASAVLKQYGLFAAFEGFAYLGQQLWRERPGHHLAPLQVFSVNHLYLWHLHALIPLRHLYKTVLAGEGVVVCLKAWRGRAEQRFRPVDACENGSHAACMIARSRVLLLERRFVLLVNDHQSKPREGQKHRRTRPENDVVRLVRQLLAPHLRPFGIGVFGVVDAHTVAEHALQPLHNLHREGYFGQEIEHLLPLFYCLGYEVDIDFGLSARCNPVEQHRVFAFKQREDGVVGRLLRLAELLHVARLRLLTVVQPSHFALVCGQYAALHECRNYGRCGVTLVQQSLACGFLGRHAVGSAASHGEIALQGLALLVGTPQHVKGHAHSLFRTEILRKNHILLLLDMEAFHRLQSGRHGRLENVANGRHIVVGYPLPQPVLPLRNHRFVVHHEHDVLHGVALRLVAVHLCHDADVPFRLAEWHKHAHSLYRPLLQSRRYGVCEQPVERQRKYDVSVGHGGVSEIVAYVCLKKSGRVTVRKWPVYES